MRFWVIGAVAAVCLLAPQLSKLGHSGNANPIEAKARRDDVILVATGDPAMDAAREKGRATLERFLAVNANRPPNSRAFAVKIPLRDAGLVEWVWIADFQPDGDRFRGTIDNTPRIVANVRKGQQVNFQRAEIADWMYVQDGRLKGNFSACALLAKEKNQQAREEFMRKLGMDCSA